MARLRLLGRKNAVDSLKRASDGDGSALKVNIAETNNSADNLQIDTLVTRMESEARIRQTQLIGPLQFGAWTKHRPG